MNENEKYQAELNKLLAIGEEFVKQYGEITRRIKACEIEPYICVWWMAKIHKEYQGVGHEPLMMAASDVCDAIEVLRRYWESRPVFMKTVNGEEVM